MARTMEDILEDTLEDYLVDNNDRGQSRTKIQARTLAGDFFTIRKSIRGTK